MTEGDDKISLHELAPSDSPSSTRAPSAECPSAMTEEAVLDNDAANGDNAKDRDSPTLHPELAATSDNEEGDNPPGDDGSQAPAQPRLIAVTPVPGNTSPDIKSDHDSGVKIDNDDNDDDIPEKKDTAPAPSPSLASSAASLRSMSPEPKPAARKGVTSQPPRFNNDVRPEGYHRPAGPAFNRAVGSLQCKAMLVIMGASIIAMVFVVGFIILQSDDEEKNTRPVSLDGNFSITNRPYNSTDYEQLSEEFANTMNATFQNSASYKEMYNRTTVHWIGSLDLLGIMRPIVAFTLNLVIPAEDAADHHQESTTTEAGNASSARAVPPVVSDIIGYLVNVTANGDFGNFTGQMTLK